MLYLANSVAGLLVVPSIYTGVLDLVGDVGGGQITTHHFNLITGNIRDITSATINKKKIIHLHTYYIYIKSVNPAISITALRQTCRI